MNYLSQFLQHAYEMLNPGGQIILDSSDIEYLYADGLDRPKSYYGEIQYCYQYKGEKGEWFDWVYIDASTLQKKVESHGLKFEHLITDENDQYLGRITGF